MGISQNSTKNYTALLLENQSFAVSLENYYSKGQEFKYFYDESKISVEEIPIFQKSFSFDQGFPEFKSFLYFCYYNVYMGPQGYIVLLKNNSLISLSVDIKDNTMKPQINFVSQLDFPGFDCFTLSGFRDSTFFMDCNRMGVNDDILNNTFIFVFSLSDQEFLRIEQLSEIRVLLPDFNRKFKVNCFNSGGRKSQYFDNYIVRYCPATKILVPNFIEVLGITRDLEISHLKTMYDDNFAIQEFQFYDSNIGIILDMKNGIKIMRLFPFFDFLANNTIALMENEENFLRMKFEKKQNFSSEKLLNNAKLIILSTKMIYEFIIVQESPFQILQLSQVKFISNIFIVYQFLVTKSSFYVVYQESAGKSEKAMQIFTRRYNSVHPYAKFVAKNANFLFMDTFKFYGDRLIVAYHNFSEIFQITKPKLIITCCKNGILGKNSFEYTSLTLTSIYKGGSTKSEIITMILSKEKERIFSMNNRTRSINSWNSDSEFVIEEEIFGPDLNFALNTSNENMKLMDGVEIRLREIEKALLHISFFDFTDYFLAIGQYPDFQVFIHFCKPLNNIKRSTDSLDCSEVKSAKIPGIVEKVFVNSKDAIFITIKGEKSVLYQFYFDPYNKEFQYISNALQNKEISCESIIYDSCSTYAICVMVGYDYWQYYLFSPTSKNLSFLQLRMPLYQQSVKYEFFEEGLLKNGLIIGKIENQIDFIEVMYPELEIVKTLSEPFTFENSNFTFVSKLEYCQDYVNQKIFVSNFASNNLSEFDITNIYKPIHTRNFSLLKYKLKPGAKIHVSNGHLIVLVSDGEDHYLVFPLKDDTMVIPSKIIKVGTHEWTIAKNYIGDCESTLNIVRKTNDSKIHLLKIGSTKLKISNFPSDKISRTVYISNSSFSPAFSSENSTAILKANSVYSESRLLKGNEVEINIVNSQFFLFTQISFEKDLNILQEIWNSFSSNKNFTFSPIFSGVYHFMNFSQNLGNFKSLIEVNSISHVNESINRPLTAVNVAYSNDYLFILGINTLTIVDLRNGNDKFHVLKTIDLFEFSEDLFIPMYIFHHWVQKLFVVVAYNNYFKRFKMGIGRYNNTDDVKICYFFLNSAIKRIVNIVMEGDYMFIISRPAMDQQCNMVAIYNLKEMKIEYRNHIVQNSIFVDFIDAQKLGIDCLYSQDFSIQPLYRDPIRHIFLFLFLYNSQISYFEVEISEQIKGSFDVKIDSEIRKTDIMKFEKYFWDYIRFPDYEKLNFERSYNFITFRENCSKIYVFGSFFFVLNYNYKERSVEISEIYLDDKPCRKIDGFSFAKTNISFFIPCLYNNSEIFLKSYIFDNFTEIGGRNISIFSLKEVKEVEKEEFFLFPIAFLTRKDKRDNLYATVLYRNETLIEYKLSNSYTLQFPNTTKSDSNMSSLHIHVGNSHFSIKALSSEIAGFPQSAQLKYFILFVLVPLLLSIMILVGLCVVIRISREKQIEIALRLMTRLED